MNPLDRLQGQVAALTQRISQLEALVNTRRQQNADAIEARAIATLAGLEPEPQDNHGRQALAQALRARAWSFGRIGRVIGRSERTAKRYCRVSRDPKGQLTPSPGVPTRPNTSPPAV